jgi:sulfur-oxidizing protein SoxY
MAEALKETGAMPDTARATGIAAFVVAASFLFTPAAYAKEDIWSSLKQQTFGDRKIKENDGTVVLQMTDTAEDAAMVPLTVRVPPTVKQTLKSLTLVIDNNPDPVIAKLAFGPAAGIGGERSFSTRVRIESFSHVRAILETEDGTLHMAKKFVAAAGGCAAVMAKDQDSENEGIGQMIVKTFPPALDTNPVWSAQIMLKHPNSNGMQRDIDTFGYIPARFVKGVTVKRDGDLVFEMDSTFSISTNPNFRFTFGRGTDNDLDVEIVDTDQTVFTGHSDPAGS